MTRRSAGACFGLLFLLGLLLTLPVATSAQENTSPAGDSLAEYRRAVMEAEALLRDEPPRLAEARRRLSAVPNVTLPNGDSIPVAPLLGDDDAPIAVEAARSRLRVVLAQLDAATSDHTRERLDVLDGILAGPVFQRRESLLDQVRRWLSELLERWFSSSQPIAAATPATGNLAQFVGWVVVGIAAVALILLLARWIQTVRRAFVAEANRRRSETDALPTTPTAARQAASRHAQDGDYRAAVRYLYLAALMTLQERRIVPRDPSLTNREVLARTPTEAPIHAPLASVVEVFDDVWYGIHEPDAATFEHYRVKVDELARTTAPNPTEEPSP